MQTLDYTLLTAFVGFLAALAKYYLPDFPLTFELLLTLALALLARLGVDVVGQTVREFLHSRFPNFVAPSYRQEVAQWQREDEQLKAKRTKVGKAK